MFAKLIPCPQCQAPVLDDELNCSSCGVVIRERPAAPANESDHANPPTTPKPVSKHAAKVPAEEALSEADASPALNPRQQKFQAWSSLVLVVAVVLYAVSFMLPTYVVFRDAELGWRAFYGCFGTMMDGPRKHTAEWLVHTSAWLAN